MKLQRRSAFGWGPSGGGRANPTRGIAVHYEGADTGIAEWPHSRCKEHWKATRRFHMGPARRWFDVGYSFAVCPHYVLEGRGKDRAQAAQPGGNTTWYSVTFMTGPGEQPHPGQIRNFRELRAWLRADDVAAAIRPHSSFVDTGCPGNILRRKITNGSLAKGPIEEDDMPLTDADVAKVADAAAKRLMDLLAADGGRAVDVRQAIAADVWNTEIRRALAEGGLGDSTTAAVHLRYTRLNAEAAHADAKALGDLVSRVVEVDQPHAQCTHNTDEQG